MEITDIQLLNMLATTFLALATFVSAYVALKIASNKTKIEYNIKGAISDTVNTRTDDINRYYAVTLTNKSIHVDFLVSGAHFILKRKNMFAILPHKVTFPSDQFNTKKNYGEQFAYYIDIDLAKQIISSIKNKGIKRKKIKFGFSDSLSNTYMHKIKIKDLEDVANYKKTAE